MQKEGITWLVGLGNPGHEYAGTRHNVGFRVVEELARRRGAAWRKSWRCPVRLCRVLMEDGREAVLVKPLLFMNRSGDAVAPLLRKRGVAAESTGLIYDDVDLPLGRIRIRAGGSAGGHRGVQSMIERIGTAGLVRIRVGVGRDTGREAMVGHVLGRFRPEEKQEAEDVVARAADAAWCMLNEGVETAMNRFNPVKRKQREDQ